MKTSSTLTEQELVGWLQQKDEKAFNYLYDNYAGALYGLALKMVAKKEHAEEIIQDSFVKIWKNISSYAPDKGRLYTWMLNIMRNTALDYIKSKNYRNEQQNLSLPDVVNNNEINGKAPPQAGFTINDILKNLKPEWQDIIKLSYIQGYTQAEIAIQMDMPLGTVKTRIRNALLQLKTVLNDHKQF